MKKRVLIAEDDVDLGHLLRQYLELNGFEATRVFTGKEARALLSEKSFDIAILDIMMPEEDGLTLGAKLKKSYPDLPFLFVTAKKTREDILAGLKLGADDYITKPFDADELVLRIGNILSRAKQILRAGSDVGFRSIGSYQFYPEELQLVRNGITKMLTEKEAKLLLYLHKHTGILIRREQILKELWDESDFFSGRSMDVFITRLRKYLAEDPGISIDSVRGVGYQFSVIL